MMEGQSGAGGDGDTGEPERASASEGVRALFDEGDAGEKGLPARTVSGSTQTSSRKRGLATGCLCSCKSNNKTAKAVTKRRKRTGDGAKSETKAKSKEEQLEQEFTDRDEQNVIEVMTRTAPKSTYPVLALTGDEAQEFSDRWQHQDGVTLTSCLSLQFYQDQRCYAGPNYKTRYRQLQRPTLVTRTNAGYFSVASIHDHLAHPSVIALSTAPAVIVFGGPLPATHGIRVPAEHLVAAREAFPEYPPRHVVEFCCQDRNWNHCHNTEPAGPSSGSGLLFQNQILHQDQDHDTCLVSAYDPKRSLAGYTHVVSNLASYRGHFGRRLHAAR